MRPVPAVSAAVLTSAVVGAATLVTTLAQGGRDRLASGVHFDRTVPRR